MVYGTNASGIKGWYSQPGSMSWPSASGIPVYAGSGAWGSSLTAPGSAIVGVSDTQTLTNKTLTAPTLTTPVLGTPASGNLANCAFPTLNQNTTGTAAGLSGSQTAKSFYAAPNGSSGTASFRSIVASDIPTLNQSTTGAAGSVTGEAFPASGIIVGTTDTQTLANKTLNSPTLVTPALGTPTSGNLANCTFPTLNQNTTGTAANVTGVVAAANGGTGSTASPNAANGVVILNSSGQLPAVSGANLTNLTAAMVGAAPATTGTGILKGNGSGGTTLAVSGADYAPATSGSAILKGNGAGGFTNASPGTDYVTPTGSITGQAGSVAGINGLITAGSNVTISGSGTVASPYAIASSGGSSSLTFSSPLTNTGGVVSITPGAYTPATTGTAILKGNGTGGTTAAVSNTDYAAVRDNGDPTYVWNGNYLLSRISDIWSSITGNLIVWGSNIYGTNLATVLTTIGSSTPANLIVPPGTFAISANVTVSTNIRLLPQNGANISVPTGDTLTINGPFEAGSYQVFSCAGTGQVIFAKATVNPYWWQPPGQTDWTASFAAAIAASPTATSLGTPFAASGRQSVSIPPGVYPCNISLLRSNVTIQGAGPDITIFTPYVTTNPVIAVGNGTSIVVGSKISGFSIGYPGTSAMTPAFTTPAGISLNGAYECYFDNFSIYNLTGDGIYLNTTADFPNYLNHFTNFVIRYCELAGIRSLAGFVVEGAPLGNQCYCDHFTIYANNYGSSGTGAPAAGSGGNSYCLYISDNQMYFSNGYLQPYSDCGIFLHGSKAAFSAVNLDLDGIGDGGSLVGTQFDTALTHPIAYYIAAVNCAFGGLYKFTDGTTAAGSNTTAFLKEPVLYNPHMCGGVFFPDTAATSYLTGGQLTDESCYVNNIGGYLRVDAPNGLLINGNIPSYAPSATADYNEVIMHRSGGSLGYPDIFGNSGGLVLGSTSNHETQLALTTTAATVSPGLTFVPLTAAPSSPVANTIYMANRTNWDPLSKGSGGPYFVWYDGSAWVGLSSQ